MEKEKLKKGIDILYDMELNNYMITRMISQLDYKISKLGHKQYFDPPAEPSETSYGNDWIATMGGLGMILGGILGGVVGCSSSSGVFTSLWEGISGLFVGGIIGIVFGLIIGAIIAFSINSQENSNRQQKYEAQYRAYERDVEADKFRVKQELQKKEFLIKIKYELLERRNLAQKKLNQFYNTMHIDKDYRNLLPIAYMSDFIRLNIATKLEGADGLYYLVRKELRYDLMQLTLEDISQKLDTIIDNQSKIYRAPCDMNDQSQRLISAIDRNANDNAKLMEATKNCAELAAYNSGRIAREAEYQTFLMTINHK
ncbi:MAG: hypothetical protein IJ489_10340 [Clostridia bacterium]|nr:hypothetical protein [Clostridia bacterium]